MNKYYENELKYKMTIYRDDLRRDIFENYLGTYQYIYRFKNNYGASVVDFISYELAVIKFIDNSNLFELDYTTKITDDIIGGLNEYQLECLLSDISKLKGE